MGAGYGSRNVSRSSLRILFCLLNWIEVGVALWRVQLGKGHSSIVGDDAVADAPLEVGLRVGLDEGVDGSDDAVLVTAEVAIFGSDVSVATDAHRTFCGSQ